MPTLLIFRPVQSDKRTQRFGDNQACARTRPGGAPIRPYQIVNKKNGVCPPGSREFYKLIGMKGHNGQDNATWHGEPVYHSALFKGFLLSGHDQNGGLNVMVVSNDLTVPCTEGCPAGTSHHVLMIYAHGLKMVGWDKKPVGPGDNIMLADNTGESSGDHCHFAPKWCEADGTQIHLDNGYSGAFSPEPFFHNTFILDYLAHAVPAAQPTPDHPTLPQTVPTPIDLSAVDVLRKTLFRLSLAFSGLIHPSS